MKINLEKLYIGFVNSFNSLLLPYQVKKYYNRPQETVAVIDYFRRLGISLGYYPWLEHKYEDLAWFDEDNKEILHLESENTYAKATITINRVIKSISEYGIALIWSDQKLEDFEKEIKNIKTKIEKDILVIVRFGNEYQENKCLVKAWLLNEQEVKTLPDAYILFPVEYHFQTMKWKNE
jgi:hypothetical protein